MGKDKGKQQRPASPPPPLAAASAGGSGRAEPGPTPARAAPPHEESDSETLARLNTQHGVLEKKLDELIEKSALSGLAGIVASAVAEGQRKTEETIDSLVAQVSSQSARIERHESRFAGIAKSVQALRSEMRAEDARGAEGEAGGDTAPGPNPLGYGMVREHPAAVGTPANSTGAANFRNHAPAPIIPPPPPAGEEHDVAQAAEGALPPAARPHPRSEREALPSSTRSVPPSHPGWGSTGVTPKTAGATFASLRPSASPDPMATASAQAGRESSPRSEQYQRDRPVDLPEKYNGLGTVQDAVCFATKAKLYIERMRTEYNPPASDSYVLTRIMGRLIGHASLWTNGLERSERNDVPEFMDAFFKEYLGTSSAADAREALATPMDRTPLREFITQFKTRVLIMEALSDETESAHELLCRTQFSAALAPDCRKWMRARETADTYKDMMAAMTRYKDIRREGSVRDGGTRAARAGDGHGDGRRPFRQRLNAAGAEPSRGVSDVQCRACQHRFSADRSKPIECPKCGRKWQFQRLAAIEGEPADAAEVAVPTDDDEDGLSDDGDYDDLSEGEHPPSK